MTEQLDNDSSILGCSREAVSGKAGSKKERGMSCSVRITRTVLEKNQVWEVGSLPLTTCSAVPHSHGSEPRVISRS